MDDGEGQRTPTGVCVVGGGGGGTLRRGQR